MHRPSIRNGMIKGKGSAEEGAGHLNACAMQAERMLLAVESTKTGETMEERKKKFL